MPGMGTVKQAEQVIGAHPSAAVAHLILQRIGQDHHSTVGALLVNVDCLPGVPRGDAVCFTLEDRYRAEKVPGETRIGEGLYPLTKEPSSGILDKMRRWYPEMGFIVGIKGVPNFTLVRIHTGNKHSHSEGCPLLGNGVMDAWKLSPDEAMLVGSRDAYRAVHERVFVPLFDAVGEPKLLVRDEGHLLA